MLIRKKEGRTPSFLLKRGYMTKKSFISISFVLVTLIGLCQNTSTNMLNTSLSPFANYMWNSKTMGGLLTSFFNIGSIGMAFISGLIIQKLGNKLSLVTTCLLYACSTIIFIAIPTEQMSLLARLLQGISKGMITVTCASVIAEVVPIDRMNEGMGIFGLGNTFSMAFGPMIALNLIGINNNYQLMFTVCTLIVLVAAILSLFLKYQPSKIEQKNEIEDEYRGIWKFIEKMAILPSLIYTIFFGSFACIIVFLTVYSQEILGLSANQISMFYVIATISMLATRLFAGKVADKYGELYIVIPGCLSMLIMLMILAFGCSDDNAYVMFLIAGCLYGIGNATVQPALNTIAVVDSPKQRSSIANATFYFMMDFGILFASMTFGRVIDTAVTPKMGYITVFIISAIINLTSLIMAIVLLNRKARAKRRLKSGIILD